MLCSLGGVCSPPSMSVLQHSKPNFDSKVALEIPIHDGRDREQTNPSVQYRGGRPIAFVLREQVSQIFHSGGREGNRLLILGAMDPEATVLGIHLVG